jgi:hypothetical protein
VGSIATEQNSLCGQIASEKKRERKKRKEKGK